MTKRELKVGDRLVDWRGRSGVATNLTDVGGGDTLFDLDYDTGVQVRYAWVYGRKAGQFFFEDEDPRHET